MKKLIKIIKFTTSMANIIDENQTLNLDKLKEIISYQFEYEVNNIKLDD